MDHTLDPIPALPAHIEGSLEGDKGSAEACLLLHKQNLVFSSSHSCMTVCTLQLVITTQPMD